MSLINILFSFYLRIGEEEHTEFSEKKKIKSISSDKITLLNNSEENIEDEDFGLWIGSKKQHLISNQFYYYLNQFKSLIIKRFIHSKRNRSLVLSQLIIPVAILLINLVYIKYGPIKSGELPSLSIDISKYGFNYNPYNLINEEKLAKNEKILNSLARFYTNQFKKAKNSIAFNLKNIKKVDFCSNKRESIEQYLSCLGNFSYNKLIDEHFIACDIKINKSNNIELIGHFNNQPFHVSPLAINTMSNTLLKYYTNSNASSINVINHPLPRQIKDIAKEIEGIDMKSFNLASGLNFGFSFLISSFAVFLIKERTSGAKHLQYLNGCSSYIFWLSAFFWDFLSYIIPVTCVVVLLIVRYELNED